MARFETNRFRMLPSLRLWTNRATGRIVGTVDPYKLALVLLAVALIPLFYITLGWEWPLPFRFMA